MARVRLCAPQQIQHGYTEGGVDFVVSIVTHGASWRRSVFFQKEKALAHICGPSG